MPIWTRVWTYTSGHLGAPRPVHLDKCAGSWFCSFGVGAKSKGIVVSLRESTSPTLDSLCYPFKYATAKRHQYKNTSLSAQPC